MFLKFPKITQILIASNILKNLFKNDYSIIFYACICNHKYFSKKNIYLFIFVREDLNLTKGIQI